MLKIIEEPYTDIQLKEMKKGDIARIIKGSNGHEGCIVTRYKDDLIELNAEDNMCWLNIFVNINTSFASEFRVRILPKGTKLEIV